MTRITVVLNILAGGAAICLGCCLLAACTDDVRTAGEPIGSPVVENLFVDQAPGLPGRLAYDGRRNRLVFVAGDPFQTWEWAGDRWNRQTTPESPPALAWIELRYYPKMNAVICLGVELYATYAPPAMQVWAYDGLDWRRIACPTVPPYPFGNMVYDARRDRLLYTAGKDNYYLNYRVWSFDGLDWAALPETTTSPTMNYTEFSMARDEVRDVMVLSGLHQATCSATIRNTWEWDEAGWREMTATDGKSDLVYYSRDQVILGFDYAYANGQTTEAAYRYDQGQWILAYQEVTGQDLAAFPVDHPAEGKIYTLISGETVAFDPETGWALQRPRNFPVNFTAGKAAYFTRFGMTAIVCINDFLRDRVETWLWDGQAYHFIDDSFAEVYDWQFRESTGLIEDPAESRLLLFSWHSNRMQVWANEGSTWQLLNVADPRPPRMHSVHLSEYPPGNCVIVLGAVTGESDSYEMETWEFRGDAWRKLESARNPPPIGIAGMAYDSIRGTILLYGGDDLNVTRCLNETWEFKGQDWRRIDTVAAPQFRSSPIMSFHEAADRLFVTGGHCGDDTFGDFWEYAGGTWSKRDVTGPKLGRFDAAGAYDPVRHVVVVAGGMGGRESHSSVFEVSYR